MNCPGYFNRFMAVQLAHVVVRVEGVGVVDFRIVLVVWGIEGANGP